MIYDIEEHSLDSMLKDRRLIDSIKHILPNLSVGQTKDHIMRMYQKTAAYTKPSPIKSNDHQPCITCGSSNFQRTGTCFVCSTCGSSQGCS